MGGWILLAVLASIFWGIYALLAKLATGPTHGALTSRVATFYLMLGILAAFIPFSLWGGVRSLAGQASPRIIAFGAGLAWAFGMLCMFGAFQRGADISRAAPIYNTNTLLSIILGIVILREAQNSADVVRLLLAGVLVTVGVFLVAK